MADEQQTVFKLDSKAEQGFVKYFKRLPQTPDLVRFFDRKGYFTVHGEHAAFIANEFFHTTTALRVLGDLPSLGVAGQMFETIVRELLCKRGYKVEVLANERGAWAAVRRGSPGNIQDFEDMLFEHADMSDSPVIMAVRVRSVAAGVTIGLAYADCMSRVLGYAEFLDNDHLSNLEAACVQLTAKECLYAPGANDEYDANKVAQILSKCDVVRTEFKRGEFATGSLEQDLARLLRPKQALPSIAENELALSCMGALVKYLDLLADDTNFGRFSLRRIDLDRYMRLDSAAVRALNLVPLPGDGNKSFSLFGLLNQCRTAMGARLLQVWLRQPLMRVADIVRRQDLVEVFVADDILRRRVVDDHLRRVPDVNRIAKKFARGRASLQDVATLYQVVGRLKPLHDTLSFYSGAHRAAFEERYLSPLGAIVDECTNLIALVEATIDLERLERHEYAINPQFDRELQRIRDEQATLHADIEACAHQVSREISGTLKLERSAQFGFYLRLSRKDEREIRGNKKYVQLDARKDGVRFTTARLSELSKEYVSLDMTYDTKQSELVAKAIATVATYLPVVEEINQLLAELDVIVSLATVAVSAATPFVRPTVSDDASTALELIGARHPCMERLDDVAFIANDVVMRPGSSSFMIITGPNMGGKSTYIRMTGVLVLMAQVGCFVPCTSARVRVCDSILARVGAGDALLKGVSTFMAEMIETTAVLNAATPRSLIIIDELGRGTSTYDGFGLAWAISEHIATNVGCLCLFATHFHELTNLAKQVPTVRNRHVTALTTSDSLTLLYRVEDGPSDESFGIHVAELAKFPSDVVEAAKRKAAELEGAENAYEPPMAKRVREQLDVTDAVRETLDALRAALAAANGDEAVARAQVRRVVHAALERTPALAMVVPETA